MKPGVFKGKGMNLNLLRVDRLMDYVSVGGGRLPSGPY